MKKILIAIGFILLTSLLVDAGAKQLAVDPAHTEIKFGVQHIYATTSGRFSEFEGDVFFDPGNLAGSRFNFTVKVKSINTFDNKRDKHLLSKDFFDADTYPVMRFVSEKIIHMENNQYALEGKMTIKDVTRPLKIEFYYYGPMVHPFDKKKVVSGFNASFSINRLDYHVGDGRFLKMGVVGENVDIDISMEVLGKK